MTPAFGRCCFNYVRRVNPQVKVTRDRLGSNIFAKLSEKNFKRTLTTITPQPNVNDTIRNIATFRIINNNALSNIIVNLLEASADDDSESTEEAINEKLGDSSDEGRDYPLKGKEYGFKYEKHEPTMHGDWSHMGRVTDF